eukprot:Amastigsp_a849552_7.p2 type:complete len:153 gc:universal Amastigsp_a849552_7:21-479(+)
MCSSKGQSDSGPSPAQAPSTLPQACCSKRELAAGGAGAGADNEIDDGDGQKTTTGSIKHQEADTQAPRDRIRFAGARRSREGACHAPATTAAADEIAARLLLRVAHEAPRRGPPRPEPPRKRRQRPGHVSGRPLSEPSATRARSRGFRLCCR